MKSVTFKTSEIEEIFKKRIVPFVSCLGVDTASKTGWVLIDTDPRYITIKYGFLDFKKDSLYVRYDKYIDFFKHTLEKNFTVVIEDTFYRRNPEVYKKLSRFGMIVYTIATLNGITNKLFLNATQARKYIGLKSSNKKKETVHKELNRKIKLPFKDKDIIDAFILALNGILI